MTKADIINLIQAETNLDRNQISAIVDALMTSIKNSLEKRENVYLRGFGTFHLKKHAKKIGRNISQGTSVNIPPYMGPAFKPGIEFRTAVKAKVK